MSKEAALTVIEAAPLEATSSTDLLGTDPAARLAMAQQIASLLAPVVRERKLTSRIQGREYVLYEGWTLLGSLLGVFPVTEWVHEIERGYEARVVARTLGGQIVGAAHARCTRDERNWRDRDDFALASMAQTRAGAKALRMPLGFVVQLAGYEATPADEMVDDSREGIGGDLPRRTGGGVPSRIPQPQADPLAPILATDKQRKLIWARAKKKGEELGIHHNDIAGRLKQVLEDMGFEHSKDVTLIAVDFILEAINGWTLQTFGEPEPPAGLEKPF